MSHEAYYQKLYTDYRMNTSDNQTKELGGALEPCHICNSLLHLGDECPENLDYVKRLQSDLAAAKQEIAYIREGYGGALIAQWKSVEQAEAAERRIEGLEKVLELTQQELNNANKVANEAEAQFRKAKEWNALMELELKNLRSIVDDQAEDLAEYALDSLRLTTIHRYGASYDLYAMPDGNWSIMEKSGERTVFLTLQECADALINISAREISKAAKGLKGDAKFREFRKDGWPLCPTCGEDELYSLSVPATVESIVGCYRCSWEAAKPSPTETEEKR